MRAGWWLGAMMLAAAPVLVGGTAGADVKAGVDAWARGDFKRAVEEWRAPALAGDPDAQYNLGQAYKLGRGVPVDPVLAQSWYLKAANKGHLQAADNYGIGLYQSGRKAEAAPWLEKSSARGEPRTQLVLATMLFNGDGLPRDAVRAYALMTRASQQGLKSASENLAQMDGAIGPEERQRGTELARRYAAEQDAQRLASVDGSHRDPHEGLRGAPRGTPAFLEPPRAPGGYPPPGARVPPPPETPRDVAAQAPREPKGPPRRALVSREAAPRELGREARRPTPIPVSAATGGRWRVQLGAFRDEGNARDQWARVAGALHGAHPSYVKAGAITRLQAGPFASRADAARACHAAHVACDVVAP